MKTVKVTYLESGTFIGEEEDVYNAKIKFNEKCIVLREKDYLKLKNEVENLKKELKSARLCGDVEAHCHDETLAELKKARLKKQI